MAQFAHLPKDTSFFVSGPNDITTALAAISLDDEKKITGTGARILRQDPRRADRVEGLYELKFDYPMTAKSGPGAQPGARTLQYSSMHVEAYKKGNLAIRRRNERQGKHFEPLRKTISGNGALLVAPFDEEDARRAEERREALIQARLPALHETLHARCVEFSTSTSCYTTIPFDPRPHLPPEPLSLHDQFTQSYGTRYTDPNIGQTHPGFHLHQMVLVDGEPGPWTRDFIKTLMYFYNDDFGIKIGDADDVWDTKAKAFFMHQVLLS